MDADFSMCRALHLLIWVLFRINNDSVLRRFSAFYLETVITVWSCTAHSTRWMILMTTYNIVSSCMLLFIHIPGKQQDRITQKSSNLNQS